MIFFHGRSSAQEALVDTIYVESVNFNVLTFFSVPCDKFAATFGKSIKFKTINNSDTSAIMKAFLKNVKYKKKNFNVDIRAKIIYQPVHDAVIEICTNGYEILVDGRLIRHNNKFASFLRILTM